MGKWKERLKKPFKIRFFEKISVGHESGCWVWTGSKRHHGYGQIKRKSYETPLSAHRASWELFRGKIPKNLCVCHVCDNPPCVNPDHLFLGTMKDNVNDMITKKRAVITKGIKAHSNKLKECDVLEIFKSNETNKSLSKKFNVGKTIIWSIKNKKKWVWLTKNHG